MPSSPQPTKKTSFTTVIKLIASDLDGTLIGHDFHFRKRTLEALSAARDAGVQLVVVTGRPFRWLDGVLGQLPGYDSYAICSNGAVTYHVGKGRVVATRTLAMHTVLEAHQILEREFPTATFTAETVDTVFLQGDVKVEEGGPLENSELVWGNLAQILSPDAQVVKYLVRVEGYDPEDLLPRVAKLVGERVSVTHAVPGDPLIEMAAPGLNKGAVLADFAAERGIKAHEVAAFGDMPNDLEMLQWAGHGYALESGSPSLRQAVARTCPAFDQDGVAQIIEKLLTRTS